MEGNYHTAPEINITCPGVLKLLQTLNPNKAAGPDNIPPRVLKVIIFKHTRAIRIWVFFLKSTSTSWIVMNNPLSICPFKSFFETMSVRWCPVSRITTPFARKFTFHWILMKTRLVRTARETSKFYNWSLLLIVAAVIWLKYCRYGVKLYSFNESINLEHV